MDKRYGDIANVIRKNRDATTDFETRVTINNPDACVAAIYEADDADTARERYHDLREWINSGGFPPPATVMRDLDERFGTCRATGCERPAHIDAETDRPYRKCERCMRKTGYRSHTHTDRLTDAQAQANPYHPREWVTSRLMSPVVAGDAVVGYECGECDYTETIPA